MKKNIKPRNDKNQPHGLWEYYWGNGELGYKCVFINAKKNGIDEYCMTNGIIYKKNFNL